MIEVLTNPKARLCAKLLDELRPVLGAVAANKWILAANPKFGGQSPICLIKADRHDKVAAAIQEMKRDHKR